MSDAISSLRGASDSKPMAAAARLGLAARAVVYLVIGWLAIQIALGHSTPQANQKGALADIASHTGGTIVLWVLGIGFAAYALWRLSEAVFGTAADGPKAGPRAQSLASEALLRRAVRDDLRLHRPDAHVKVKPSSSRPRPRS